LAGRTNINILCTYAELTRRTEELLREFEAKGIRAEKVTIDVDHMAVWCKRHGYPISDAASRVKERLN
jgi:hypothetical protein